MYRSAGSHVDHPYTSYSVDLGGLSRLYRSFIRRDLEVSSIQRHAVNRYSCLDLTAFALCYRATLSNS